MEKDEKEQVKNYPVIIAGFNKGEIIAESLLKIGFENISLFSIENEELSDINQITNIKIHKQSITDKDELGIIQNHKVLINMVDFEKDTILILDRLASQFQIPIIHPINLGEGGLVVVTSPSNLLISQLIRPNEPFDELKLLEYFAGYQKFWGDEEEWLNSILDHYKTGKKIANNNLLPSGNNLLNNMCTQILIEMATKKQVKIFPDVYLYASNN